MEQSPADPKLPAAKEESGDAARVAVAKRRVVVLYNTDYDPIPEGAKRRVLGRDRSDVAAAAFDVKDAIAAYGLDADIMGVEGRDIAQCIEKLRKNTPDLIFNLTESLAQDSNHEI